MDIRRLSAGRVGSQSGRVVGVLLGLAVLGLAVLVWVQGRVGALGEEVRSNAAPAEDLVGEMQYILARQTSALRGYLASGDATYLRQYDSLHALERATYPVLETYSAALSPEVSADVAEFMTLSREWHRRLLLEEIAAVGSAGARLDAPVVLLEQELYRSALDAASRATLSIREMSRDRHMQIQRIERDARLILVFLFFLSGGIAVFISIMNGRIRTLALETEERRQEVESAMDRTDRAVAARQHLIRGFTHDVKNPLHVADGYADLLRLGLRGELPAEQAEVIGKIRAAIRGAVEIIDTLLDIDRMESGGLKLDLQSVGLAELAEDVIEEHAWIAAAAGLELTFRDPGREIVVLTDPDRVRQILKNLVSNAVKYTPSPGTVKVGLDVAHHEGERTGWVQILVTDTGPGIASEQQERVFYEFYRVPGASVPGQGLGLPISQRIARLLGGEITLRSVLGQGATFTLWLPLPDEHADRSATAPQEHGKGAHLGATLDRSPVDGREDALQVGTFGKADGMVGGMPRLLVDLHRPPCVRDGVLDQPVEPL
jgi:signal transduction histidine kinase